ncbi:kinase domain protein (macronuclear) [Tetrahymena thermophila SB210]|uniref:non-specific serine/threonine protein kinase n=1 Tax=Tetrahymena thermophila (strain SB210) TaxID=312017 RepID=I7MFJ9_TETTS|nr:kinase domain protein [Tetrahymena thermophila SB210]EAS00244.2 kinase domain protein [Tetrahymena thermophila SB210]|eukprot:XP_001020489.2 kinase domain protein [Tetrahymena thermophila SB210]
MKPNLAKKFAEDEALVNDKPHQQNHQEQHENPQKPPPIQFENNDFLGVPEMEGLTTKSDKQVYNIDEENDSEDEGIEDYKIGGYHPVHIGEVINKRYVIIQKLGWGHFSTVWLSKDFKYDTYVALKIQKSAPHYLEAAYDEVEILQKVAKQASNPQWIHQLKEYYKDDKQKKTFTRDDCQVVQLLNSFVFRGPYGNHFCMVFEILGVNLLEIIKRYNYKGIPMHLARIIAKQVLIGLDFLHRYCGVIHTDLKPENVLLCLTQEEIRQIVEKGQLENSKKFQERIKFYQKAHGIKIDEVPILDPQEEQKQNGHSQKENHSNCNGQQKTDSQNQSAQNPNPQKQEQNDKNNLASKQEQDQQNEDEDDNDNDNDDEQEEGATSTAASNQNNQGDKKNLTKKQKKNQRRKAAHKRKKQREKEEKNKQTNDQDSNKQQNNLNDKQAEGQKQQIEEEVKEEDIPEEIRYKFDNWNGRGDRLQTNVRVKIADLGNACWTHHHFATEIQTRQYRSPETIIGVHYDTTADVWSFACMIFEMLTGDFLFEPRKGPNFSKNDDHIAQIQELCNKFTKKFALSGFKSKKYFDKQGNLRRIPSLHYWPLLNVLIEKYHFKEEEAKLFDEFMQVMLKTNPLDRASAHECLQTKWIHTKPNYLFKYTDQEFIRYQDKKKLLQQEDLNLQSHEAEDSDNFDGDLSENDISIDSDDKSEFQDDKFFGKYTPQIDQNLIDRSFTNLGYIGFGDGIKLDELDQDPNWQFMNLKD